MDQRGHPRVIVDRHIMCEIADCEVPVFMCDLSLDGCMLETDRPALAAGDTISLMLAAASQVATIVWTADKYVGARFAVPLHPAIIEHYGFVPGAIDFGEMMPKDKFGRPLPPLKKEAP